jgi:hypothetical protein
MAQDSDSPDYSPKVGPKRVSDAWVFVSHSHSDLEAIRRVRDEFERLHANPLLFFLMCLKDDEEVDQVIKREITACNVFLICDSPAAQKSGWVQKERQFVLSLKDRALAVNVRCGSQKQASPDVGFYV